MSFCGQKTWNLSSLLKISTSAEELNIIILLQLSRWGLAGCFCLDVCSFPCYVEIWLREIWWSFNVCFPIQWWWRYHWFKIGFHFQFPRIIANLGCLSDVVCLPGLLRRLLSPSSSCGSIGESLPGSQSTSPASLSPCPLSLVLCQSEQSWPPYLQTNVNLTHKLSAHVSV